MCDIQQERARLDAEKTAIDRRGEKRHQAAERDSKRRQQINEALLRLDCLALLNVAGGVVVRHREPAGTRWAVLNDATGTMKEVRRTRGLVDFGTHGDVLISLDGLLPAKQKSLQSQTLLFGGAQ